MASTPRPRRLPTPGPSRPWEVVPARLAAPAHPAPTPTPAQGAILASSDRGGIRIQYSKNPFGKKREMLQLPGPTLLHVGVPTALPPGTVMHAGAYHLQPEGW
jgi:hypothetical protein